jgi:hypothetical protein
MRNALAKLTVTLCLIGTSAFASAQARKPGLWEITTNMTWQQSPMPAGMGGAHSPFGGGTHTTQACITQALIDKYGGMTQQGHECQVSNIVKASNKFSADLVCSGAFSGKGSIDATWTDDEHAASKTHFVGAMQMGADSRPFEWTSESTSVFKSSDCGSVKPIQVPDK